MCVYKYLYMLVVGFLKRRDRITQEVHLEAMYRYMP